MGENFKTKEERFGAVTMVGTTTMEVCTGLVRFRAHPPHLPTPRRCARACARARMQTSVKDALKKLQETLEDDKKVEELEDVRLCMVPWQMPLITKMDPSLGTLKKCKHLRLSSNQIDRIGSLAGMGAQRVALRAMAHCRGL